MLIDGLELSTNQSGKIVTDKPTLWHCHVSRSLRCLWALEESGLDFDLINMQFPPRMTQPNYKEMNVLGTVPYFVDGETHLTESSGICHYLVEKYRLEHLRIDVTHPEYGDYINWLFMSDATLLFPQTIVMRYSMLEPKERRSEQVAEDYRVWFLARLKKLNEHIIDREYLCANKFTIADITIGYALYFAELRGLGKDFTPQVQAYLNRLKARDSFKKVVDEGEELSPFVHPELWTKLKK